MEEIGGCKQIANTACTTKVVGAIFKPMAKIIKPEELGKHVHKMQGKQSDKEFLQSKGITRQTLSNLKAGRNFPKDATLKALGLEQVYRTVGSPETATPPAKVASKKAK